MTAPSPALSPAAPLERHAPPTEPRTAAGPIHRPRWLRFSGLLAIAVVGLPVIVSILRFQALFFRPYIVAWLAAYTIFLAGYVLATARNLHSPSERRIFLALVAVETFAALIANALIPTPFGGVSLGGLLLVVVAAQVALVLSTRLAFAWIAAQTVLLAATYLFIARWPTGIALVAAGAYLAFQVFSLLAAHSAAREATARAELAEAHRRLLDAQARLARSAADAERARLLRELHDVMGHHLAALSLNLEAAAANLTEGRALELVRNARGLARLMLADIRSVLSEPPTPADDLPPLTPADLRAALVALGRDMPGITVDAAVADPFPPLPAPVAHALIRAAQEAVTNAVRHGGAQRIVITLRAEHGRIRFEACDDGRGAIAGFAPGSGLSGMRARIQSMGGSIHFENTPGGPGFRITAEIALPANARDPAAVGREACAMSGEVGGVGRVGGVA